jgi:Icc-related predicted phosphoesterase
MRLAVLADIHGSLPALEAVLADARQRRVDQYIVAGGFFQGSVPPGVHCTADLAWLLDDPGNSED